MDRSTKILLVVAIAIGLSACSMDSRSAEERAFASFEERDFLDTRIHLANAIKEDPKNPSLRRLQGETALALGDGQVAETAFKKAIEKDNILAQEINPFLAHAYLQQQKPEEALELLSTGKTDSPYSQRLIAQAKLQNGDMAEAWTAIEKAIAAASNNGDILSLAGQYQLAVGNIEEAKRFAKRALAKPGSSVEAYLLQGRIHSIAGDLDQALEQYKEGAKFFRDHVRIYISQAAIYADLNDTDNMEKAIANVERISPGHPGAAYILARYSLNQGDMDRAYELAQNLESASGNNPPLLMLLGEVQSSKGNHQQAISHLRAYLRLSPKHPTASLLLAKALEESGSLQEANDVMVGAVSRAYSPKSFVTYAAELAKKTNDPLLPVLMQRSEAPALDKINDQLAHAQEATQKGDWKSVAAIYDKLITGSFENHPMLLNNAAMAHLRQGNGDRALELAERAYALTPDDPSVLDSVGWIRLNVAEDRAGSQQVLSRAFQMDPANMQIRLHLAQALVLNGQKAAARHHLEQVMAVVDKQHHKAFDDILTKL